MHIISTCNMLAIQTPFTFFKAYFYVIRHKIAHLDNDLLYLQGFFIEIIVRFIFLNIFAFC